MLCGCTTRNITLPMKDSDMASGLPNVQIGEFGHTALCCRAYVGLKRNATEKNTLKLRQSVLQLLRGLSVSICPPRTSHVIVPIPGKRPSSASVTPFFSIMPALLIASL